MYFRTTIRRNRDGSVVKYHQLAHSYRDPDSKKPCTEIIYNFGRADQLDRAAILRLCNSMARALGIEFHWPDSQDTPVPRSPDDPLPKDLGHGLTRELGPVLAIEGLWESLGLRSICEELALEAGFSVPYERALFAMTANRLCEPESKLGVWDRWLPKVHLPSAWELKLDHFYQAMDLLAEHAAQVEEMVFFRTADLFNLEVELIFYDTTTASFCIDFEDDEGEDGEPGLRRWGRDKDGGSSVQVVVALAVTKQGLPVRSWVFPGNTSDVTTVARVKADLKEWKLGRCLFVADCGMNSEESREELARACGKYLLAVRADRAEVREHVLTRRGRYKHLSDNLRVKEVEVGEGEKRRRYFLCFNPKEAQRQKKRRAEVLGYLRAELARHNSSHTSAKWTAQLRASQRTGKYLSVNKQGCIFVDAEKIKRAEKLDGKWVLMSNDDTLSAADAASGYKALLVIEDCFRSLKSVQVELMPMYHWLPRRITAHVKLCVLALLLQRVAELRCNRRWSHLREELSQLQATQFRSGDKVVYRRNDMPGKVGKILKKLDVALPKRILGTRKVEEQLPESEPDSSCPGQASSGSPADEGVEGK